MNDSPVVSDMVNELAKLFKDLAGDYDYYVIDKNKVLLAYQGLITIVRVLDVLGIETIYKLHHEKYASCAGHSIVKLDETETYLLSYNKVDYGLPIIKTFNISDNKIFEVDMLERQSDSSSYNELRVIDEKIFMLRTVDENKVATLQRYKINKNNEAVKVGEIKHFN